MPILVKFDATAVTNGVVVLEVPALTTAGNVDLSELWTYTLCAPRRGEPTIEGV